jgi:hypothetical protein
MLGVFRGIRNQPSPRAPAWTKREFNAMIEKMRVYRQALRDFTAKIEAEWQAVQVSPENSSGMRILRRL